MSTSEMVNDEAGDLPSLDDDLSSSSRARRRWPWALLLLLIIVIYNAWVAVPVFVALSGEHEYTIIAYRRWLVSPSTIVLDVWGVEGTASMAGMDRNLFKAAEALKNRDYDGVVLAYRGIGRFILDGARFKTIGMEREFQNPVFVIRTLAHDVNNLDGSPAFPAIYGGWLGVLGEEINQHNELHRRWWMNASEGISAQTGSTGSHRYLPRHIPI